MSKFFFSIAATIVTLALSISCQREIAEEMVESELAGRADYTVQPVDISDSDELFGVITSYSIHYTKLYDIELERLQPQRRQRARVRFVRRRRRFRPAGGTEVQEPVEIEPAVGLLDNRNPQAVHAEILDGELPPQQVEHVDVDVV